MIYRLFMPVSKEKCVSEKYVLIQLANCHFISDINHSNGKISFLLRSNSWLIRTILPTNVQLQIATQNENIGFAIECRYQKEIHCFFVVYFLLALLFLIMLLMSFYQLTSPWLVCIPVALLCFEALLIYLGLKSSARFVIQLIRGTWPTWSPKKTKRKDRGRFAWTLNRSRG